MCDCCDVARGFPDYNLFCPKCVYCGARQIQFVARFKIPVERISQMRKDTLKLWIEHGHDEQQIRRLAKGELAICPEIVSKQKVGR